MAGWGDRDRKDRQRGGGGFATTVFVVLILIKITASRKLVEGGRYIGSLRRKT